MDDQKTQKYLYTLLQFSERSSLLCEVAISCTPSNLFEIMCVGADGFQPSLFMQQLQQANMETQNKFVQYLIGLCGNMKY